MIICTLLYVIVQLNKVLTLGHPNFIFVLTDDQDVLLDGLKPMQKTLKLIANDGIIFENAFVNSPICCPSRSSILTGKYAHNTRVLNNSINGNCSSSLWQNNFEKNSIAALLKKSKNYTTFYAGKYLNQYGSKDAGGIEHVPSGYDWWLGLKGNSRYYNYTLSINGSRKYYEDVYLTDLLAQSALDFMKLNYEKPFFMTIAPPACHAPFTGANRHLKKFPKTKAVQNPSFNYSSEGKHWIVKMRPEYLPSNVSRLDIIQRKRLQTLLAVDEMVEKIIIELKNLNIFNRTYFIFTSDNGYHIGQFGQPWDKRQPYETDIRVPFMMRGPNIPKKKIISYPISAVDIAPTILDLANAPIPADIDGESFKTKLIEPTDFNKFILIEYWGEGNQDTIDTNCFWKSDNLSQCTIESWCKCQDSRNNSYICVLHLSKNIHFKFCQFFDEVDFGEAYNLKIDPYELRNIYKELRPTQINYYKVIIHELQQCKGENCNLKLSTLNECIMV
ncbi:hypothetical protein HHI36_021934 [Cryptolaemus montrouzieri]|uniref:Sulfatase N-terminal domain-containing protein n=1 Tax=Cryptolaemus montrouzieri TaxID=559131 RepID=A0ABD2MYB9_9CUCU